MPLIAYRERREKTALNTEILSEVNKKILEYCEWAGITDVGFFVEEAAKYIFANDLRWRKYLEENK